MQYTVIWYSAATDELARIWLGHPDRAAITQASALIDDVLARIPDQVGRPTNGERYAEFGPLVVIFLVDAVRREVHVQEIWQHVD